MATAIERNPIRNRGLTLIPYGSHEEWLKIRKGYIGGSDAGAIIGLNPYASAFSVWAEKAGSVPEFEGNISTRVGTYLEDLVAKLFMEETGKTVQRLNFTIVNPAYPWACANIDREVIGEDAVLEIKTTTSFGAIKKFRSGEYPEQWYGQMVHYLAVTGGKESIPGCIGEQPGTARVRAGAGRGRGKSPDGCRAGVLEHLRSAEEDAACGRAQRHERGNQEDIQ